MHLPDGSLYKNTTVNVCKKSKNRKNKEVQNLYRTLGVRVSMYSLYWFLFEPIRDNNHNVLLSFTGIILKHNHPSCVHVCMWKNYTWLISTLQWWPTSRWPLTSQITKSMPFPMYFPHNLHTGHSRIVVHMPVMCFLIGPNVLLFGIGSQCSE